MSKWLVSRNVYKLRKKTGLPIVEARVLAVEEDCHALFVHLEDDTWLHLLRDGRIIRPHRGKYCD